MEKTLSLFHKQPLSFSVNLLYDHWISKSWNVLYFLCITIQLNLHKDFNVMYNSCFQKKYQVNSKL